MTRDEAIALACRHRTPLADTYYECADGGPAIAAWVVNAVLEASQAAAQQGWQPIETAPRNSKDVLVFTETGLVRLAFFDTARGGIWSSWPGRNEYKPTHWQPLPSPPTKEPRDA
jgi:hypothetical protein